MKMSVEHWWKGTDRGELKGTDRGELKGIDRGELKGTDRGELKYSEKNLPQCHFIHLKSYMN